MGGAVFSPCSLAWGQTMVGGPPSKGLRPGPLYSVPLTPRKSTVYSCLHWRLLDTHRQVWWARLAGLLFQFVGLSAWWLYGGAHTPCFPGLLLPESLSLWQAAADPYLHRRHSNTQRQVWLSLLWGPWVLACTKFCLSPLSISGNHGVWF